MVRWAWGSRSIRQTVLPISARAAPRLTVVVVLPTPPFWFIRAMVRMQPPPCARSPSFAAIMRGKAAITTGDKKRSLPPWQGRLLFVSGPQLEPGPKTLEVRNDSSDVPAGATCRRVRRSEESYFFDLVVDFLPE